MTANNNDYSKLTELMTAREYVTRFEPHLFEIFPDIEVALQEDTDAAAVASRYDLPRAVDGRYPRVIWDMATAIDSSTVGPRSCDGRRATDQPAAI